MHLLLVAIISPLRLTITLSALLVVCLTACEVIDAEDCAGFGQVREFDVVFVDGPKEHGSAGIAPCPKEPIGLLPGAPATIHFARKRSETAPLHDCMRYFGVPSLRPETLEGTAPYTPNVSSEWLDRSTVSFGVETRISDTCEGSWWVGLAPQDEYVGPPQPLNDYLFATTGNGPSPFILIRSFRFSTSTTEGCFEELGIDREAFPAPQCSETWDVELRPVTE